MITSIEKVSDAINSRTTGKYAIKYFTYLNISSPNSDNSVVKLCSVTHGGRRGTGGLLVELNLVSSSRTAEVVVDNLDWSRLSITCV